MEGLPQSNDPGISRSKARDVSNAVRSFSSEPIPRYGTNNREVMPSPSSSQSDRVVERKLDVRDLPESAGVVQYRADLPSRFDPCDETATNMPCQPEREQS